MMDPSTVTWTWLIVGAVLIFMEVLLPGLIVMFLGLSAIGVAALRGLGWIDGWLEALTAWTLMSVFFFAVVRNFILNFMPGERRKEDDVEEGDAIGAEVEVIKDVDAASSEGQISYRGTVWKAQTLGDTIPAGGKARIIERRNLVWLVAPVESS